FPRQFSRQVSSIRVPHHPAGCASRNDIAEPAPPTYPTAHAPTARSAETAPTAYGLSARRPAPAQPSTDARTPPADRQTIGDRVRPTPVRRLSADQGRGIETA